MPYPDIDWRLRPTITGRRIALDWHRPIAADGVDIADRIRVSIGAL